MAIFFVEPRWLPTFGTRSNPIRKLSSAASRSRLNETKQLCKQIYRAVLIPAIIRYRERDQTHLGRETECVCGRWSAPIL